MSALCLAATLPDEDSLKDKNAQMMNIILEKSASVNYSDKFQRTALHLASATNNQTAVQILLN